MRRQMVVKLLGLIALGWIVALAVSQIVFANVPNAKCCHSDSGCEGPCIPDPYSGHSVQKHATETTVYITCVKAKDSYDKGKNCLNDASINPVKCGEMWVYKTNNCQGAHTVGSNASTYECDKTSRKRINFCGVMII